MEKPEATGGARVVLVTGAARRIGAAIATTLHGAGWRVAVHCHRSIADAAALVAQLNAREPDSAALCAADLRDVPGLTALAAAAAARWGRLDALVNNASSYLRTPFAALEEAQFDELLATNFKAPLFLTRACLAHFGDDAGVVNVLDTLARHARPGFVAYNAAKAALWAATETLAAELAPTVRVNGVAPGHILWAETTGLNRVQQQAELAQVPLQRLGTPQEIADAVAFLLSPQAAFLNGAILPVDGGLRLK